MRSRDLSVCCYYRNVPPRVCGHGCYDEPRCITEEPLDHWPLVRRAEKYLWAFGPAESEGTTYTEHMLRALEIHERIVAAVER